MIISMFMLAIKASGIEVDCVYVQDTEGNYVTVPGSIRFKSVQVDKWTPTLADLCFIV